MEFKTKLILLAFVITLVALSAISGISTHRMYLLSEASFGSQKKALLDDYDDMIKGQVQTAVSLLAGLEDRSARGEITVDEAKRQGADLVRKLRYRKDSYFWIDTIDGTNVVMLGKSVEGKNRISLQDETGKFFIKEIIAHGRRDGGGFTDYLFPKADGDIPLPKRGYSLEFKPWGWVVGTGNYTEDTGKNIDEHRIATHADYVNNARFIGVASFIMIFACFGFGCVTYSRMKEKTEDARLAENELKQIEVRYFQLLQSTNQGIYSTDMNGCCTFINSSGLAFLGYQSEDCLGKNIHALIHHSHPDGSPYPAEECPVHQSMLEGARYWKSNETLWRRDGSSFHAEFQSTPLIINGEICGAVATFSDITDRRLYEEKLATLSRAVEQSPATIVITDPRGSIEFVNPRFTELTGYTAKETLGQNSRVLKSGKTPPETFKELWSAISSGAMWEGELINKSKDGREFIEYARISPVYDEYDAISHYVAVKEDITEKKKYIEEIITAKELAEAGSRSKSDFLATMSHELRTPMNGVIGMTDILLDTVLDDEQREYVEIVSKSGNEMLEIINNILDYSSMESRELDLETNDFNLLVTLRETADLLAVRAGNAGLELISHISSEVPTLLKGDPVHLHQIIVNLVDNAIKYTHDGEIVMRTALDSESRSSAVIRFEIQDTGIGIPSSHHVTIFAPFTQVDGSFSRKFGGIGLGLATCKKLVELMGGTIGVSSEEGEGSVFWFTARFEKQFVELEQNPAALEDDHPSREAESLDTLYALNETIPQKPQILLAEDDNANREVLSFILKSLGFRVDTVENGREAVRALETADYGLVLMDCMMPEMDGFEATAWIRDPQSTVLNHDVPIVAITSNSMTGDKEKCLKAGMNGYLPKPVNTVELVKILDTWLWSG